MYKDAVMLSEITFSANHSQIQITTKPATFAMEIDAYDVRRRLRATKKIFDRACSQLIHLTNKLEDAKIRYNRAKAVKRLSFKYNSQLRVTSLEGLRNAIYQYASSKCEEIDALQDKHKELTHNSCFVMKIKNPNFTFSTENPSFCWGRSHLINYVTLILSKRDA